MHGSDFWRGCGLRAILGAVALAAALLAAAGCATQRATKYPVLYLDLDGTALSSSGRVLDETVDAVRAYRNRGGRLGIATGRTLEQASDAMAQLEPDLPVVLYNGGTFVHPERRTPLRTFYFPAAVADSSLALVRNVGPAVRAVFLQGAGSSLALGNPDAAQRIASASEITITGYLDGDAPVGSTPFLKMLLFVDTEDVEHVQIELAARLPATTRCVISSPHTIEILPRAVNKAVAITAALDSLGWAIGDVVVLGDSGNDVEMIRDARIGVAMANARPETKAVADLIIGDHDDPAIALFVRTILLDEGKPPQAAMELDQTAGTDSGRRWIRRRGRATTSGTEPPTGM